jgi:hypothetical protein
MEKTFITRSPRAFTAIAAVIALSSTHAIAQEAAPTLSLPQNIDSGVAPGTSSVPLENQASPAPGTPVVVEPAAPTIAIDVPPAAAQSAPSTQPTIMLPDAPAPATEPSATTQAETSVESAPPQASATQSAPQRSSAAATAPSEAPRVPTAQSSGTSADGVLADGAVPAPVLSPAGDAVEPVPEQAGPAVQNDSADLTTAGIAGLLAALGIAGAGAMAMARRRRRRVIQEEGASYAVAPAASPVASRPADATTRPPAYQAEPEFVRAPAAPRIAEPASSVRAAPRTMPMGRGVPADPELRRALIEEMVAAEPDDANPFHTRKARRRRARILLQEREAAATQNDAFDWRTYRPTSHSAAKTTADAQPVRREPETV